jgi:hypothetical protein
MGKNGKHFIKKKSPKKKVSSDEPFSSSLSRKDGFLISAREVSLK